jgi:hypothetical protein
MSLRHRLDLTSTAPSPPMRRMLVHATTSVAGVAEVRSRHHGFDAYDQRALLMAEHDDLVVVQGAVDLDYLTYLAELGIGPRASNILAQSFGTHPDGLVQALLQDKEAFARLVRQAADSGLIRLEPFIAGPFELQLAERLGDRLGRRVPLLGDPAVVEQVNRKDVQRQWAQELGVPVAQGEVVTLELSASDLPKNLEPLRSAITRRLSAGQRVLLRGCEGASGSATRIVASNAVLEEVLGWASTRKETAYLVDQFHDVQVSPNVLVFVPPEQDRPVRFVAATDQILDASLSHVGNRFPSAAVLLDEMVEHAELLGRRLRTEGYAGWVGCDFCEYRDAATGKPALFFAELNARINGACYPVALAARWRASGIPTEAFVSGFVKTAARSFGGLAGQLGQRLLRLGGISGVLPYNSGCLGHGYYASVVIGETPKATRQMWNELVHSCASHR